MALITAVVLSEWAKKQLLKVPHHVVRKLTIWVRAVEISGIDEVRKMPGFHDEPLRGKRAGQRSIRLNRAYRAIYEIRRDHISFVSVEEVTKHDY